MTKRRDLPEARILPERYSVTDNGDYEWIVDNQTGEEVSPRTIVELLNQSVPNSDAAKNAIGALKSAQAALMKKCCGGCVAECDMDKSYISEAINLLEARTPAIADGVGVDNRLAEALEIIAGLSANVKVLCNVVKNPEGGNAAAKFMILATAQYTFQEADEFVAQNSTPPQAATDEGV